MLHFCGFLMMTLFNGYGNNCLIWKKWLKVAGRLFVKNLNANNATHCSNRQLFKRRRVCSLKSENEIIILIIFFYSFMIDSNIKHFDWLLVLKDRGVLNLLLPFPFTLYDPISTRIFPSLFCKCFIISFSLENLLKHQLNCLGIILLVLNWAVYFVK